MSSPGETLLDPEELARLFHQTYEALAERFGYETRPETRVPWDKVPEENRLLVIAVCRHVVTERFQSYLASEKGV